MCHYFPIPRALYKKLKKPKCPGNRETGLKDQFPTTKRSIFINRTIWYAFMSTNWTSISPTVHCTYLISRNVSLTATLRTDAGELLAAVEMVLTEKGESIYEQTAWLHNLQTRTKTHEFPWSHFTQGGYALLKPRLHMLYKVPLLWSIKFTKFYDALCTPIW